jgi:heme/copper-type cytochrome/quinol oxidase subunit 2
LNFDIFHYSTPNVKLFYPEPFIASPTFIHDDLWFIHIVIYQYWLWFFFIFLIVFFFITFLSTVRWCNLRFRPARETRGVSRSKCGDLITATVPVSWATSIIIHESTDAIEFADGFGTTELAVGIRAYQWGWEYYYPKDLNDSFNYKNTTKLLGNGLVNDASLPLSKSKNGFKNNQLASVSSSSGTSLVFSNKSYSADMSTYFDNFQNFNTNKLLNSSASSLITSSRLGVFSDLLATPFGNSSREDLHSILQLDSTQFIESIQPKYAQLLNSYNFLPSLASYNYSYAYSNLSAMKQFELDCVSSSAPSAFNFFSFESSFSFLPSYASSSFEYQTSFLANNPILGYTVPTLSSDKASSAGSTYSSTEGTNLNWANIFFKSGVLSNSWKLNQSVGFFSNLIANQDFKRYSAHDLFEDYFWDLNYSDQSLKFFYDAKQLAFKAGESHSFAGPSTSYQPFNYFFKDLTYTDQPYFPSLGFNSFITTSTIVKQSFNLLQSFYWLTDFSFNAWSLNQSSAITNALNFSINEVNSSILAFQPSSILSVLNVYSVTPRLEFTAQSLFNLNLQSSATTITDISQSAKNLNTFSQAFTKVFKSSIEEERVASLFKNLSSSYNELPAISSKIPGLLGFLQKNNNWFVEPVVYKSLTPSLRFTTSDVSFTPLVSNFMLQFPFTTSSESDIIRYSWFDWYSVRNSLVAKAMDTSVFGLHGAKYYSFSFTNNNDTSLLNQVDNFFNKYTHARKFYIPMYTYNPFLYEHNSAISNSFNALNFISAPRVSGNNTSLSALALLTNTSLWFDSSVLVLNFDNSNYSVRVAGDQSYVRNLVRNSNLKNDSVSSISKLADILSVRTFLYKRIVSNSNLLGEVTLVDSSSDVIKSFKAAGEVGYPHILSRTSPTRVNLTTSGGLLKSQYQPLRKGITNMIRIQADKAIAMPIETRLQILAVSKDIIHSWSIPSAGIKIDCIPGYSSHRVAIFLVSGIYWGQCMEICGRFHHWMPIVVYFMKRDLFCLWCLHFIFITKNNSGLLNNTASTSQNIANVVTYAPSNWLYEL